jgi:hypothetical protein
MTDKNLPVEVKIARIVCLDSRHEKDCLFAEVIDIIEISDRYWVKPLALARFNPERFQLEFLYDLRDTSQLILPIDLFRDALDTEVIPLISELYHPVECSTPRINAQTALHQFIADLFSDSKATETNPDESHTDDHLGYTG